MLILVGSVIAPMAGLLTYSIYSQYADAELSALREAFVLANLTADTVAGSIHNMRLQLQAMARRPQMLAQSCATVFSDYTDGHPYLANLVLTDRNGDLLCSSVRQPEGQPVSFRKLDWHEKVFERQEFVVSEVARGVITGVPRSVWATPVFDGYGRATRALAASIDLTHLPLVPAADKLPKTAVLMILDSKGIAVARSSADSPSVIGTYVGDTPIARLALSRRSGTAEATGFDHVKKFYGFAPISGTDWTAIAGIDAKASLASARLGLQRTLLLGLATLILAGAFAVAISRRIMRPTQELIRVARKVAGGESGVRASPQGPREFVFMMQQFNRMLDEIQQGMLERTAKDAEIHRLAEFDHLTGLPNRQSMLSRIRRQIASPPRHAQSTALLMIGIDQFHQFNTALGHGTGDEILQRVAETLEHFADPSGFVARVGGDEFAVLVDPLAQAGQSDVDCAMQCAERLRTALAVPLQVGEAEFHLSASIGVTLLDANATDPGDAMRDAEIAMHQAKANGRSRAEFFAKTMQTQLEGRMLFERELTAAIDQDALCLYIQPQFNADQRPVGAEMLMRWCRTPGNEVSAAYVISVAEECGLIHQLGAKMLAQACDVVRLLRSAGHTYPVSVNISPLQLTRAGFIDEVRATLDAHAVQGSDFIFEVTEGLVIRDPERTIACMRALAGVGIRFSIDDFGTGYSSLAYLKELPLYELKIDKYFVHNLFNDDSDKALVHTINAIAKLMNLRVVAEGIETREQRDFLVEAGCDAIQGYLYAKPMPVEEWLRNAAPAQDPK